MAKKSKLLAALDEHKGRDYEAEKRKKQVKAAEKRKRQKHENDDEQVENGLETKKSQSSRIKRAKLSDDGSNASSNSEIEGSESGSGSESKEQSEDEQNGTVIPQPLENADASASEAEHESDVPLSDLEGEDMEDVIPHQRLTINNGPALIASRKRVTVAKSDMPFHYHNSLISTLPPSETAIPDLNDDVTRELEFYRIARDAVVTARSKLKKEKVPFTRPSDYFAEMVKSDEHMGKVKKKLYDEAANKKSSEEARKLRDAKKFGKAVQIAKEQERAKEKRATLDNIKELKKRRKGQTSTTINEADNLFQEIAVEKDENRNKKRGREDTNRDGSNLKRQKRDSKYGFGGKKRFSKSGDAMSSSDMSGFSARKMKGSGGKGGSGGGGGGGGRGGKRPTTKRLGKSKRAAARS